jgi:hypothetical protein
MSLSTKDTSPAKMETVSLLVKLPTEVASCRWAHVYYLEMSVIPFLRKGREGRRFFK